MKKALNPTAKNILDQLQSKWGMSPTQKIDVNDPMTRLVMAIAITKIEQGRDLYSTDQYIKGCAKSAGVDAATFEQEINPAGLGIENSNGSAGFVSPSQSYITGGGGSVAPYYPSYSSGGGSSGGGYSQGGSLGSLSGIVNMVTSIPGVKQAINNAIGTVTAPITNAINQATGGLFGQATGGFSGAVSQATGSFSGAVSQASDAASTVSSYTSGAVNTYTGGVSAAVSSAASLQGAGGAVSGMATGYEGATATLATNGTVPMTDASLAIATWGATMEGRGVQSVSDVTQSMLNRVETVGYQSTLSGVVLAPSQYSTVSALVNGTTDGFAGNSPYSRVTTPAQLQAVAQNAIDNGQNPVQALVAYTGKGNAAEGTAVYKDIVTNGPLIQNSRETVGGATDFLGANQPGTSLAGGYIWRGGNTNNKFGFYDPEMKALNAGSPSVYGQMYPDKAISSTAFQARQPTAPTNSNDGIIPADLKEKGYTQKDIGADGEPVYSKEDGTIAVPDGKGGHREYGADETPVPTTPATPAAEPAKPNGEFSTAEFTNQNGEGDTFGPAKPQPAPAPIMDGSMLNQQVPVETPPITEPGPGQIASDNAGMGFEQPADQVALADAAFDQFAPPITQINDQSFSTINGGIPTTSTQSGGFGVDGITATGNDQIASTASADSVNENMGLGTPELPPPLSPEIDSNLGIAAPDLPPPLVLQDDNLGLPAPDLPPALSPEIDSNLGIAPPEPAPPLSSELADASTDRGATGAAPGGGAGAGAGGEAGAGTGNSPVAEKAAEAQEQGC